MHHALLVWFDSVLLCFTLPQISCIQSFFASAYRFGHQRRSQFSSLVLVPVPAPAQFRLVLFLVTNWLLLLLLLLCMRWHLIPLLHFPPIALLSLSFSFLVSLCSLWSLSFERWIKSNRSIYQLSLSSFLSLHLLFSFLFLVIFSICVLCVCCVCMCACVRVCVSLSLSVYNANFLSINTLIITPTPSLS